MDAAIIVTYRCNARCRMCRTWEFPTKPSEEFTPDLLRKLRERQLERGLRPWTERAGLAAWAFAARRPALYRPLARLGARLLRLMGGDARSIRSMPLARGWSGFRDLPTPRGPTFKERWRRQRH